MLQFIRSKVTSIFVKILFVLLIVSFAIWGIGDVFFGSPAGKVAVEIGDDVRYTTQEVAEQFEQSRRRLGVPLTAEQAMQLGLLDQVIQDMVTEGLMLAAVKSLDLSVGTDRVVQFVRSRFVDQAGNFDRARYQTVLANNGWSEEEFVSRLRQDFTRRQLIDALIAVDAAPQPIVDRLFAYREEKRVAQVVSIPASVIPEPAAPEAAALESFYDANKSRYEEPEYRTVSWAQVSPTAVAKGIDIPESELRAAYDERAGQLSNPERREVRQILFETQDAAASARARIEGGEDFAAVAKDSTGVDEASLDLGMLTRDGLPDGTADAVFRLVQGEVSQPVESPFGWHLFRVERIQPGSTTSFEEARDRIRDELAHDRALDQVYETANRLEDALAGGATLEEAAKSLELPVSKVVGLSRSGARKGGGTAEGLPGGQFTQLAFETAQGQQSSLGEGENGGFFVLRVDAVEAPRTPGLDEIRDRVLADWKAERRLELAEEKADALAEKVRGGGDLKDLAAAEQLPTAELPAMTRAGRGLPEGYPGTLPATLFGLSADGDVAVTADDSQAVVVRRQQVLPADQTAKTEVREAIANQIAQGVESDVIELLLADLRSRLGVTVDKASVQRLYETVQ
ncbi:peptidyl-prolyl cis-trans isomerase [Thalassobaculum sp.]|uniref:peptidyl-prolyl cis-trans isomerase n=1 Tax=Thalassobaculum sp. TaxID=2022740 RepID=UPI0032EF2EBE